ncbi:hypothetical protein H6F67_00825 [Microcoleus sp. FACHB-1515]|uniref:hypothetical protein n=1 Tax=Cyanophyceae TaxID=3028117 RepID=UPI001682687A|nr:hypothetical protein [Microcoleus sp. FACHB-1515]MBD2088416.1 hypothetical protein [Microcoleus sp. FACHB-1515]
MNFTESPNGYCFSLHKIDRRFPGRLTALEVPDILFFHLKNNLLFFSTTLMV